MLLLVAILAAGCASVPAPTPFSADPMLADRDAQELEDFRHQYARLRALDPHRNSGEFRSKAKHLFGAMEREVEQARARQAPHEERVREIYEECRSMYWSVALLKDDAIARGLELLGEFLQELEADLALLREIVEDERRVESIPVR